MKALVAVLLKIVTSILAVTFAVFVGVEVSIWGGFRTVVLPGGFDESSPRAQAIIEQYHLDHNVVVRYGHWIVDALNGDFGRSTRGGVAVSEVLTHRLSISLELMLAGVLLTVLVGIPMGLWAAAWSGRRAGAIPNSILGLAQSIPVYITPVFLIWIFAVELQWVPAAGWVRLTTSLSGNLQTLFMPAMALAFAEIGIVGRIIRADALRVMQSDFVVAAVGKGLKPSYVLFRHVLRPASLGLLNVVGLNIGSLLSGAVIVEILFGIGGLGQVLLEASLSRDLYLLVGLATYLVVIYTVLNTIVDLLVFLADPRIRRGGSQRGKRWSPPTKA